MLEAACARRWAAQHALAASLLCAALLSSDVPELQAERQPPPGRLNVIPSCTRRKQPSPGLHVATAKGYTSLMFWRQPVVPACPEAAPLGRKRGRKNK